MGLFASLAHHGASIGLLAGEPHGVGPVAVRVWLGGDVEHGQLHSPLAFTSLHLEI